MRDRQRVGPHIHDGLPVRRPPARPEAAFGAACPHRVEYAPAFEPLAGDGLQVIAARRIQRLGAAFDQDDPVSVVGQRCGQRRPRNAAADDRKIAVQLCGVGRALLQSPRLP